MITLKNSNWLEKGVFFFLLFSRNCYMFNDLYKISSILLYFVLIVVFFVLCPMNALRNSSYVYIYSCVCVYIYRLEMGLLLCIHICMRERVRERERRRERERARERDRDECVAIYMYVDRWIDR